MVMRQKFWVDNHVQGVLVGRLLIYWFGIVLLFGLSTLCTNWWQYPEWTLSEQVSALLEYFGPYAPTLVLLLPLVVFDMVRLSNRFAGPVHRLRVHLQLLQNDPHCAKLNFRDDDYWQQLAEPINGLQQKLLDLEEQVASLSMLPQEVAEAGTQPVTYATASAQPDIGEEDMQIVSPIPPDFPATEPFVTSVAQ